MTDHSRAVTITERLARRMDFTADDSTKCAYPVPQYGGGGGSRYYGPSYFQCDRSPIWRVMDAERLTGYCAQHARKLGLLTEGNVPIKGIERRAW